jgi:hypothetical protein
MRNVRPLPDRRVLVMIAVGGGDLIILGELIQYSPWLIILVAAASLLVVLHLDQTHSRAGDHSAAHPQMRGGDAPGGPQFPKCASKRRLNMRTTVDARLEEKSATSRFTDDKAVRPTPVGSDGNPAWWFERTYEDDRDDPPNARVTN